MKIRRILSVFLLTVLMVSLMLTPQAYALPALEIKAKAAVLVDADAGRIIFGQNEQEREYPASITKVMTALLTLEAVDAGKLSLDQPITASAVVNDQDPDGRAGGQLRRHRGGRGADGGTAAVLPAAGVRQRGGGHSGGDGIRLP